MTLQAERYELATREVATRGSDGYFSRLLARFFLRSGLECARGYSRDVVTFHLKGGEIRER